MRCKAIASLTMILAIIFGLITPSTGTAASPQAVTLESGFDLKIISGSRAPWGFNQYLHIDSLGNVRYYEGEVYGGLTDSAFLVFDASTLSDIYDSISAVDFFSLDTLYDPGTVDGSGIIVAVSANGVEHTVRSYNYILIEINRIVWMLNSLLSTYSAELRYGTRDITGDKIKDIGTGRDNRILEKAAVDRSEHHSDEVSVSNSNNSKYIRPYPFTVLRDNCTVYIHLQIALAGGDVTADDVDFIRRALRNGYIGNCIVSCPSFAPNCDIQVTYDVQLLSDLGTDKEHYFEILILDDDLYHPTPSNAQIGKANVPKADQNIGVNGYHGVWRRGHSDNEYCHECMHLCGLEDRYCKRENMGYYIEETSCPGEPYCCNLGIHIPYCARPCDGFELDIMGSIDNDMRCENILEIAELAGFGDCPTSCCQPAPVTILSFMDPVFEAFFGHYIWEIGKLFPSSPTRDDFEMGGFDFLIGYDASALVFIEAEPGQFLEDCGWEYFTYRHGVEGNCGDACPSGLLRIIAIAETNNGPFHPTCYGASGPEPYELYKLRFYVSNDLRFDCQFIPVYYFWDDCNDNSISSVDGQILYIDRAIYDFEGNLIWDEDNDDQFPENARIPFVGAPDYCLNPDTTKPTPIRLIDFVNGGVDIVCADSIDLRGDINCNGLANEIADAVMLANYFIEGLSAFGDHVEASVAASDVNADGIPLSIADLVYLIRILTGDAVPFNKVVPYAEKVSIAALVNHSAAALTANSSVDIGAGYFVFNYTGLEIGEPHLIDGVSDMALKYSNDDGVLKVLVYSMVKDVMIPAGIENIFAIPISGEGTIELTEVQLSDYFGSLLNVTIDKQTVLPETYALYQNYPNPFNASTTIFYELPEAAPVKLEIINVLGQKVVTLLDQPEDAGIHSVTWDSRDEAGRSVASGVYFYRIITPEYNFEKKMVLMK